MERKEQRSGKITLKPLDKNERRVSDSKNAGLMWYTHQLFVRWTPFGHVADRDFV